jgi:hypothetical protein
MRNFIFLMWLGLSSSSLAVDVNSPDSLYKLVNDCYSNKDELVLQNIEVFKEKAETVVIYACGLALTKAMESGISIIFLNSYESKN